MTQFRGRIHYTSRKPDRYGQERGREWFSIVVDPDGWRTLVSQSEIDDAPAVLRHVNLTVDAAWRPRSAHVKINVGGQRIGSTWYRFEDTFAECEGDTAGEGRISQTVRLDSPAAGLVCHPIQGDAFLCAAFPVAEGPHTRVQRFLSTSHDHRGATGPTLLRDVSTWTFVGREKIEVAAGKFDALHFSLGSLDTWAADDIVKHPPYHMWVSADGNFLFLRAYVEGYMQTHYELTELEVR